MIRREKTDIVEFPSQGPREGSPGELDLEGKARPAAPLLAQIYTERETMASGFTLLAHVPHPGRNKKNIFLPIFQEYCKEKLI